MRLDKYLVTHGHYESRNRAIDAIRSGKVTVDGEVAKPSQKIDDSRVVEVASEKFYVSRAAKKLENFLTEYSVDTVGKVALDIGSSTGGFAQILLEGAVGSLDCVDVGRDQLHTSLRNDNRLSLHEETDIRAYKSTNKFALITCDVSFISILQIVEDIDRLAQKDTDIIILYKPQFEVGRLAKRDSKGVVKDQDAINTKKDEFMDIAKSLGWGLEYHTQSKIAGREGNIEYFFHFIKLR